ncbi:PIH1 family [Carpediemonas membranifera]|uniref:PIH1 family n=1 Tax=Carpediemonas membranifera TaxID=201153 RepID=A0A8J6E1Z2_9EUKA|nr:PIH1 family [Carpediemonas membranifera]|eukprot:KAG9391252.1 PIH1 family [Carpediemonas membranifera]
MSTSTLTIEPTFTTGLKATGKSAPISAAAWGSDGETLVTSSETTMTVWRCQKDRNTLLRFLGHTKNITCVDYKIYENGRSLAVSVGADCTMRLWTPTARGGSVAMKAHTAAINHVCFSNDGRHILSCGNDRVIKLHKIGVPTESKPIPTATFVRSYTGHTNFVRCAVFSPDCDMIYSIGDDAVIRVWNTESGKQIQTIGKGLIKDDAPLVAPSPDGQFIAAAVGSNVLCWELRRCGLHEAHGKGLIWMFETPGAVRSLSWHASSEYIAVGSVGVADPVPAVHIYNSVEGRTEHTLTGHVGSVTAVRFTKDGRKLASCDTLGQICLWMMKERPISGQTAPVQFEEHTPEPSAPVMIEAQQPDSVPTDMVQAMQTLSQQLQYVTGVMSALEKRISSVEDRVARLGE